MCSACVLGILSCTLNPCWRTGSPSCCTLASSSLAMQEVWGLKLQQDE